MRENNKLSTSSYFLLTCLLLISNMQTTSPFSLYFLCIFVFGFLSLCFLLINKKINTELLVCSLILISFLIFITILQIKNYASYEGLTAIIISRLALAVYWGGIVGLSLGCISNVSSSSMSKVVNFVIFIMSVFIFIQIASHYFLGLNIDFSQMTGGGYLEVIMVRYIGLVVSYQSLQCSAGICVLYLHCHYIIIRN